MASTTQGYAKRAPEAMGAYLFVIAKLASGHQPNVDRVDKHDSLAAALLRLAKDDEPPLGKKERLLEALAIDDASMRQSSTKGAGMEKVARIGGPLLFNAVSEAGGLRERRLGTGAVVSLIAHAAAAGLALYVSSHPPEQSFDEPEVKFMEALPPPPPPPPPPKRAKSTTVTKPKPIIRPDKIIEKPREEMPKPEEEMPEVDSGEEEGVGGGEEGGKPGGTIGGKGDGPVTAQPPPPPPPPPPQNVTIPFGAGMSRPSQVAGPTQPPYTREALMAKVEGTLIARCVITTTGAVQSCRIIKGLPHLDQAVLQSLEQRRYAAVLYKGQPVNVEYTFPFRFKLP